MAIPWWFVEASRRQSDRDDVLTADRSSKKWLDCVETHRASLCARPATAERDRRMSSGLAADHRAAQVGTARRADVCRCRSRAGAGSAWPPRSPPPVAVDRLALLSAPFARENSASARRVSNTTRASPSSTSARTSRSGTATGSATPPPDLPPEKRDGAAGGQLLRSLLRTNERARYRHVQRRSTRPRFRPAAAPIRSAPRI
jgi:hypothetical protein